MTTDIELHDPEIVDDQPVHDAVLVLNSPPLTPISFELTLADIERVGQEASKLTIADHTDRKGFNAVYSFRQMVKDQRIDVEKRQKELKRPHIDYNRSVDLLAKQLIEPMKAIEEGLQKQEDDFKAEQERIKEEDARAKREAHAARIDSVIKLGGVLQDGMYDVFGTRVDLIEIETLPDDKWGELYSTLEEAYTYEQARLAQIEADRKAEADRLEAQRIQQEAQAKQLADQLAEIERREQELARAEAEAKRKEQERIEQEKQRQRDEEECRLHELYNTRSKALQEVGYVEDIISGDLWLLDTDVLYSESRINSMTDEEFQSAIEQGKAHLVQQEEIKSRQMTWNGRANFLLLSGFVDEGVSLEHPNGLVMFKSQILDMDDERFDAYLKRIPEVTANAEAQRITDEKLAQQQEAERKKADKERETRLAKEKKDFADYLRVYQAGSPTIDFYQQPEVADLVNRFTGAIRQVVDAYKAELDAL